MAELEKTKKHTKVIDKIGLTVIFDASPEQLEESLKLKSYLLNMNHITVPDALMSIYYHLKNVGWTMQDMAKTIHIDRSYLSRVIGGLVCKNNKKWIIKAIEGLYESKIAVLEKANPLTVIRTTIDRTDNSFNDSLETLPTEILVDIIQQRGWKITMTRDGHDNKE